jgi:ribose/xylose/arabinose/galactoside ABC-type transport system permease subunit
MYYLLRGFVYFVTGKVPISDRSNDPFFFQIGNGKLFGFLPLMAILMIVILAVFIFILRSTTYGRRLYAVGGNPEVTRAVGISPERMKFSAFVLCSVLASVSAILLASRLNSANHLAGQGFEFQVVAAAVMGGVSLSGGVGNLIGAFIGVLIFGLIQNGMGLLNVGTPYQLVITGAIIVAAVAVDVLRNRRG